MLLDVQHYVDTVGGTILQQRVADSPWQLFLFSFHLLPSHGLFSMDEMIEHNYSISWRSYDFVKLDRQHHLHLQSNVFSLSFSGRVLIRNHSEREESVKVSEHPAPFYPGPADVQLSIWYLYEYLREARLSCAWLLMTLLCLPTLQPLMSTSLRMPPPTRPSSWLLQRCQPTSRCWIRPLNTASPKAGKKLNTHSS